MSGAWAAAPALAGVIGVAAAAATAAARFPDRPPSGHTGGFGEPTCAVCHATGSPDSTSGALGLVRTTRSNDTLLVTLALVHPGMRAAGFQLSVRDTAGRQAGTFVPVDARTAVADSAGVLYLHHTRPGTALTSTDTAAWSFLWVPNGRGPKFLHIAANAADDDASPFGDQVYLLRVRWEGR